MISYTLYNIYIALFLTKTSISHTHKNPFFFCSYFRTLPITLLLQILGERMHGPSPHFKFQGTAPSSPRSRSPPIRFSVTSLRDLRSSDRMGLSVPSVGISMAQPRFFASMVPMG